MSYLSNIYKVLVPLFSISFLRIDVTSSQEGSSYFFYQQPEYPRDCNEILEQCSANDLRGVHTIKPDGYLQPFEVYCDGQISSGGWTVIQRRIDGSVTFNRDWKHYKSGFGFLSSEFWIGLDKLSYLTNQAVYELRIDMKLSNGSSFYVKYDSFRITDEWSQYQIVIVEDFTGNSSCIVSTCPANMIHDGCRCQMLCSDRAGMTECNENCEETCVPIGCSVPDASSIISNGETYVNSDCSQKCTCDNYRLICTNYECSPNAECRVQDGEGQCHCNEGYSGDGETCTTMTYTDCYDVYQAGQRQDGFYSIQPIGWTGSAFDVSCNMTIDGGGWTVLQRRVDGTESFERNWAGYKTGFGVPGPEFWLGNDKIHFITNQRDYELRMDMVNLDEDAYFAKYNLFRISNEDSKYQLELGTYDSTSTASYDAMNYHRDQFFSTSDRDNDRWDSNCAADYRDGWWYNSCYYCNFNAPNIGTNTLPYPNWRGLPGSNYFMYTDIKIRPV